MPPSLGWRKPARRSGSEPARLSTESGEPPLILTLTLDDASFALFDGLRRRHFPPERNQVPAHLTLFHTLPGDQRGAISPVLDQLCRRQKRLALEIAGVKRLGSGVAYAVKSAGLETLRRHLAHEWSLWLTPQDSQGFRPHITVQNKASAEAARNLYRHLDDAFRPFEAAGVGLHLWSYLGGPWRVVRAWRFQG